MTVVTDLQYVLIFPGSELSHLRDIGAESANSIMPEGRYLAKSSPESQYQTLENTKEIHIPGIEMIKRGALDRIQEA